MHHKSPQIPASVPCQRTRLASGSIGAVDQCDCGAMHVHVGATTLHLQPSAFCDFVRTLNHALNQSMLRDAMAVDGLPALSAKGGGQA